MRLKAGFASPALPAQPIHRAEIQLPNFLMPGTDALAPSRRGPRAVPGSDRRAMRWTGSRALPCRSHETARATPESRPQSRKTWHVSPVRQPKLRIGLNSVPRNGTRAYRWGVPGMVFCTRPLLLARAESHAGQPSGRELGCGRPAGA